MRPSNQRMRLLLRRVAHLAVLMLLAQQIPPAAIAASRHTLAVQLRDVAGAGVAGVTVQLRDAAGDGALVTRTTDVRGQAVFADVDEDAVRVAVQGMTPEGVRLTQRGLDAAGILVLLDGPSATLDLRIEPGGEVIPDPATMIAPEMPIDAAPATLDAQVAQAPTVASASGVPTAIPFAPRLASPQPAAAPLESPRQLVLFMLPLTMMLLAGWLAWQRRGQ